MKNKNLEKKLRNILMNHFELNADFKKEINIKTVHQWDSFGHISLMSEIEKSFKIKLKDKEILSLHSEKSILKILMINQKKCF